MSVTRPPDPTAPHVVRFCELIVPGAQPRLMPIRPSPGSQPLDCFSNARQLAETQGGRIQFGWSIWEWPRVYIEAEHHAVYAPPNGIPWIDVTPAVDGDTTRVFVPDDAAIYDFDNENVRRENHRMPLITDPLVGQLFALAVRQNQIMSQVPGVGMVSVPVRIAMEMDQIAESKARVVHQIGMKYTPRNQRCFCGSGDKFKHCHGRYTR